MTNDKSACNWTIYSSDLEDEAITQKHCLIYFWQIMRFEQIKEMQTVPIQRSVSKAI